jgi:hypothetical protein
MMTLTPRLLAEIDLNVHTEEGKWTVRDGISSSKYREFRRRSIQFRTHSGRDLFGCGRTEVLEGAARTPKADA